MNAAKAKTTYFYKIKEMFEKVGKARLDRRVGWFVREC